VPKALSIPEVGDAISAGDFFKQRRERGRLNMPENFSLKAFPSDSMIQACLTKRHIGAPSSATQLNQMQQSER
jgi:hypothetical protein